MDQAYTSALPSVRVKGRDRPEMREAVSAMSVNVPRNGMAHAELTLVNWGLSENATEPDFAFLDIELGDQVEILMGEDPLLGIFSGEITGIEERYGEGAPKLVLLIQDKLHRLARQRHSRSFEDQTPDDIVQAIAQEAGLSGDVNVSSVAGTYYQVNESNLAFLLRILSRFDIALRVEGDSLRARQEEADPQPVSLDAQDNALQVRLLADLNHQQTRARAIGFDAATDESVTGSADALPQPPSGTTAKDVLQRLGWEGEEIMPQPFPPSQGEADAFARGHFASRAGRFISGDILCQGEPGLRGGREVDLAGVSERLRGTYQVVHCVHRFDGQRGYETHIKVNRPDWQI